MSPKSLDESKPTKALNADLVTYQLGDIGTRMSELKIIVEQGFTRTESRFNSIESRIQNLEVRHATMETKQSNMESDVKDMSAQLVARNAQGMSTAVKITLATLAVLSGLMGIILVVLGNHP